MSAFLLLAALTMVVGIAVGRNQDQDGYNLFNRRMRRRTFAVSYAATFIGAGFFITGTAYAYQYGLGLAWFFLGLIFGVLIFGLYSRWLKEKTKDLGFYTLPDVFRWRFGEGAARAVTMATLVLLTGDIAIQLIGGAKLLEALGIMPYASSIVITVGVVAIYLLASGFRAVVLTDYLLTGAMLVLTAVLAGFSGKFFQPAVGQLNVFSVPLGTTVGFFLFGLFGPFAISTYYQRIFAADSPKTAQMGTWLGSALIVLPGAGLFIIGMAAKRLFPSIDPDLAFLKIIQTGGRGIALVGGLVLWSALMDTVDTLVFAGSQILNRDLLRRELTKRNVRYGILLFLGVGVAVSFSLPSVTRVALLFLGASMAVAPSAFFLWFMKGLRGTAVVISLVSGIAGLVAYSFLKGITPQGVGVSFFAALLALLFSHTISSLITRLRVRSAIAVEKIV
jgi:Na+/proline symporter